MKHSMKSIVVFLVIGSIQYWAVTTIAWVWALGLQFDLWKGLVIGLIQGVFILIANVILAHVSKEKEKTN